jgi:hypothetical protein
MRCNGIQRIAGGAKVERGLATGSAGYLASQVAFAAVARVL